MGAQINHPSYYANKWSNNAEIIDIIEHLPFNRGSAIKYIARAGFKDSENELDDLKKALWYINREIELIEGARKNV